MVKVLWIAFKNYYLRDTTQLCLSLHSHDECCELLSKIIIFVTRHNQLSSMLLGRSVVNCFQKLLSSWHDTTKGCKDMNAFVLWIAFKNYYLRDTTQQLVIQSQLVISCELLSKIIIFVTRHNSFCDQSRARYVVNCFQKLLSSWHDTTITITIINK